QTTADLIRKQVPEWTGMAVWMSRLIPHKNYIRLDSVLDSKRRKPIYGTLKIKMMKKYLKLILALLLTVNTLSCVDLEEKPEGLLAPETFFSSPEAFEAAVVGCYKPLYGVYAGHDTQWQ